jgi:hypothetical protein
VRAVVALVLAAWLALAAGVLMSILLGLVLS